MIWPPIKAWSSKVAIRGNFHFVAINYGGKLLKRWVVLMSVVDSDLVVKVSWSQLVESANWECGWNESNDLNSSEIVNNRDGIQITNCIHPSTDSGLTIPLSKKTIRPWFDNS